MSYSDKSERSRHSLPDHVVFFRADREIGTAMPFKIYDWKRNGVSINDHAHDYIQIWYVVKGEFMHTINNHAYRMVKGNLFVIPPYTVHRVDPILEKGFHVIGLEFMPQFVYEGYQAVNEGDESFDALYLHPFMQDERNVNPKIALIGEADMEVTRLLQGMLNEFQSAKRYYELVLRADLLKLLSIIIREQAKQAGKLKDEDERVEKYRELMLSAIKYVQDHHAEELRLETVCREFSISKSYFCQLFKRFTGKTYGDYLIEYRVHKAAELLLKSDMSVTDISYGVGFNDHAYFSRVFKRQTGVAPTLYKKQASSIQP
ncbi:helix-turn-helix domain-containing protein [Paenibacillus marinisediminis]